MQHFGSAEATKQLRSRTEPISSRVGLAVRILEGRVDVVLPRKETVILEWAFDALAIDPSARSCAGVWSLVSRVWPLTPKDARLRILKNHKFAANISESLATGASEHVEALTVALGTVLKDSPIFITAQNPQARQLLLAYLDNAVGNQELGHLIFEATKSQVRLFGKSDPAVLTALLNERNRERLLHYLTDYLSTPANSAIPSAELEGSSKIIAEALCEANVLVKERLIALSEKFPSRIFEHLGIVYAKRPNEVNADLLEELVKLSFTQEKTDWEFVSLCLNINPAPLLADDNNRSRIMAVDCPDSTMALIIDKATHLRLLTEFLSSWKPKNPVAALVFDALCRALDTLAPVQMAGLLDSSISSNNELLKLVTRAMSYRLGSSPVVSDKTEALLVEPNVDPVVKKAILDARPQAQIAKVGKRDDPQLALRAVELNSDLTDIVSSVVKRLDDGDEILLRYFPLLEADLDEKRLRKLMSKVSEGAKHKLAHCSRAMECVKITNALIESSLEADEMDILATLPKQIFSWDQRHRAVTKAINSRNHPFKLVAEVVIKLLDAQKPPAPEELGQWIRTAERTAAEIDIIGLIVRPLKRDSKYIDSLARATAVEWQTWLIKCYTTEEFDNKFVQEAEAWLEKVSKDRGMMDVVVRVLTLLPQSDRIRRLVASLILAFVAESKKLPPQLFQLACSHGHHWSVISALFVFTDGMEKEFADYCQSLGADQLNLLVMTAADECQLRILQALVSQKVLVTCSTHQRAITVAVFKVSSAAAPTTRDFWLLCDTILRENPILLTQFSVDNLLEFAAAKTGETDWNELALLTSRILLFRRQATRGRIHLIAAILTHLLREVTSADQAHMFARLVDNLCNPPNYGSRSNSTRNSLSSQVAKERRHISRHSGVLLQNIVFVMLRNAGTLENWTAVSAALRPAMFALVDLIFGSGLKAVSAGMDTASRAYLRSIFEEYKLHSRWVSD